MDTSRRNGDPIHARLVAALGMARAVETLIMGSYQSASLTRELKEDSSVVTATDRDVETRLRELIAERFPDDAINGEEGGGTAGRASFTWILDPIDGTEAFARGVPLFGTCIGITENDEPVAGVVNMPALGELFYAEKGGGAWWQTQRIAAASRAAPSGQTSIKQSLFCTTSHAGFARIGRRDLFDTLIRETKKFRGWGSCYGHMLVATGRADIMVDPDIKIWDVAAVLPIVIEAGAAFFDLAGNSVIHTGSGISCAPGVESELRELLRVSSPS